MNSKAIDFLEWAHDFIKREISENAILMSKYLKPIDEMLLSLYEKCTSKKVSRREDIERELRQIVQWKSHNEFITLSSSIDCMTLLYNTAFLFILYYQMRLVYFLFVPFLNVITLTYKLTVYENCWRPSLLVIRLHLQNRKRNLRPHLFCQK